MQWCQTAMVRACLCLFLRLARFCSGLCPDQRLLHCRQETRAWLQALPLWLLEEQVPGVSRAGFGPPHFLCLRLTESPACQGAALVLLTRQPAALQRLCQPARCPAQELGLVAVHGVRCWQMPGTPGPLQPPHRYQEAPWLLPCQLPEQRLPAGAVSWVAQQKLLAVHSPYYSLQCCPLHWTPGCLHRHNLRCHCLGALWQLPCLLPPL